MPTLILKSSDVKSLLKMPDVLKAVENAFIELGENKVNMPPKSYLVVEDGDFRAMPAAISSAAGMKWVNVHLKNKDKNLPSIMAILILNDPETGYPLAIMDATEITAYRTAAASAIASKYLARKDSKSLGVIGAGHQAHTHIMAHLVLFELTLIKVYDRSKAAVDRLIDSFSDYVLTECSIEETAASDIVCTLTPSRSPVIKHPWIKTGTHINAVGADAKGKQELESAILNKAVVIVDDVEQARAAGEINVPTSNGAFKPSQIHATLSDIIIGKKKGRIDDIAITIFDSTGIAVEDIATAKLLYNKAIKQPKDTYTSLELV
ncbi:MAG: ornithine cyclodeaminase family protein [Dehalococcoidia bacterium]|nr:MAG: ornithine cyclodeaminase family protein [Dehalococcoidia bacterium]